MDIVCGHDGWTYRRDEACPEQHGSFRHLPHTPPRRVPPERGLYGECCEYPSVVAEEFTCDQPTTRRLQPACRLMQVQFKMLRRDEWRQEGVL